MAPLERFGLVSSTDAKHCATLSITVCPWAQMSGTSTSACLTVHQGMGARERGPVTHLHQAARALGLPRLHVHDGADLQAQGVTRAGAHVLRTHMDRVSRATRCHALSQVMSSEA